MRLRFEVIFLILVTALILVGCTSATEMPPTPVPTQPPADTAAPPTDIPEPTATPDPSPTPLPEGVVFRDDFEGSLQPGWEWENENPDRWTLTDDGWLQITGEHDSLLHEDHQNNLLWYPLPEGDYVITVHLTANPFENFQQATIYIYEDPENYVAINRGYCSVCSTGGNGIYMEYKISGVWAGYVQAMEAEDVYLRLESKDDVISGYYAIEPDQWERIGRFGNYFQFQKVGIGVTNVGAGNDVVGLFDFLEISVP